MSKLFDSSVPKFLLVGILNTLVGASIMFLLYNWAGCTYWVSSACNYIAGSILSFFLNKYFTFQKKEWSWNQVGRFALNIAVCYVIAYAVAKPMVLWVLSGQSTKIQDNLAMLAGMCLYTVLNYFGQRFFAFHTS